MTNPLGDMVAKLRKGGPDCWDSAWLETVADEIERLRAALEHLRDNPKGLPRHLADIVYGVLQGCADEPTAATSFAEVYRQQSETKQGGTNALNELTLHQDGQQTPAPSGHAGLGAAGEASSPLQSSERTSA